MASSSSLSSSSSSSTLSAKAPPFIPPQHRPSPLLPSSSQSSLSAKAPPFTKPPPSQINPFAGSPYYPSYDGFLDSELLGFDGFPSSYNGDDVLEPSCDFGDFNGMSVGPWNAPLDGEDVGQLEESEVISSLWTVPSLDLRGTQPKVTAPCKISGASSSALSSQLSISTSAMESCNASHSNSSSNRYMAQNYKCSTNPMVYYPGSAHSDSAQVYALSAPKTSSIADSLSKTVDSARALLEQSTTSQKIKCKEGFDGGKNNNINVSTIIAVDSSLMKKGPPSSSGYESSLTKPIKLPKTLTSESASAKQDNSMENSLETLGQLDLDVDSPCWKGTLAYRQSPFWVDEVVTPHLTAVKSVNGIDVVESQPYIPSIAGYVKTIYYSENSENLISDETKKVSSTSHSEKSLDVASSSLQRRSEHPYIIESEGNCKGIQCLDISKEQITDMTKDDQRKSEAQDKDVMLLDQEVTVTSANKPRTADDITIPESVLKDAVQNCSSYNQCYAVDVTTPSVTVESHGSAVLSGKPSSAGEYVQLIDETLQCLRKRLLSHAYEDENALKELLSDVLLVSDYPEAFVLKKKKVNVCYGDSWTGHDWSQIRGLKARGHAVTNQRIINNIQNAMVEGDTILNQNNLKTRHDTAAREKMQPIGHHTTHRQGIAKGNFHYSMREFAPCRQIIGLTGDSVSQSNISITKEKSAHFIDSSMSDKLEGIANDFEKILKKTFYEQEENLRTLLHKNLWIESQVKLFAMKYELQLARAEIEILKHNQCAKGRLQEATRFQSLNYWQDSQASNPWIDPGESSWKFHQDMDKREKNDATLIAGLGVLEGQRLRDQICMQHASAVYDSQSFVCEEHQRRN